MLSAFVICFSVLHAAEDDITYKSTLMLEERYKELRNERTRNQMELRIIEPSLNVISTIKSEIESVKIDKTKIQVFLSDIKDSVTKLSELDPEVYISRDNPIARKYEIAFNNIRNYNRELFSDSFRDLNVLVPDEGNLKDGEIILKRIFRSEARSLDKRQEESPLDILLNSIPWEGSRKISEFSKSISAAKEYLKTYDPSKIELAFDEFKKRSLSIFEGIYKKVEKEVEYRKDRNKEILAYLENISEQLEKKRQKQTIIDQGLIYAVYGMIGVLLAMFLSLRIFPGDIAIELVKRRSLIEVVGMAFMLITIIILGTGGRIGTETLGTLLGTIAGYIFGRIGSDRAVEESSKGNSQPPDNTYSTDTNKGTTN
jgi:hypothetical protein